MPQLNVANGVHLDQKLIKRWDIEIPLKQGRQNAHRTIHLIEKRPDRSDQRGTMRIDEEILGFDIVSGHMKPDNPLYRHLADEFSRIVAMIDAVDVDIVDIQKETTICLLQNRPNEISLIHGLTRCRVVGDIFDGHFLTQNILSHTNAMGDMLDSLLRKRDRHEVIKMTLIAAIAQVFTVSKDPMILDKRAKLGDEAGIQGILASQRKGEAVGNKGMLLGQRAKQASQSATDPHPVLRRDFKKIDREELPLGKIIQMDSSESKPNTLEMSGLLGCH